MSAHQQEIRHLLARTGFGVPTPVELETFTLLSHGEAVVRLLESVSRKPSLAGPDLAPPLRPNGLQGLTEEQRKVVRRERALDAAELKGWWWSEMLTTPTPLTEHLVLFWHNHFTSSLKKVKAPNLLYEQNALYRTNALGNFATLLRAVAKDPAMLVYLDTNLNRAAAPNENFARELLELFTLGEGRGYTERDIKEAARAFTGWRFRPQVGFQMDAGTHDAGTKTFLGSTGRFDGDDIISIVLEQPRVAEHITEKLWREFISDTPDPVEVGRLASVFRRSGYEMRPLVEGLLKSDVFRSPEARGGMVKSPVDLVVGTFRLLGGGPRDPRVMTVLGRNFGQDLFDPPNVKGWPGGLEWIDTANLPARHAFLDNLGQTLGRIEAVARRADRPARPPVPPAANGADLPPALRRRLEQAQGLPPDAPLGAPPGAPPGAPLGRPGPPALRPRQQLSVPASNEQYRTLVALDTDTLAELVLPIAPVAGLGGDLGSLLVDPAYQLK